MCHTHSTPFVDHGVYIWHLPIHQTGKIYFSLFTPVTAWWKLNVSQSRNFSIIKYYLWYEMTLSWCSDYRIVVLLALNEGYIEGYRFVGLWQLFI